MKKRSTIKEAGRFGLVGLVNTALDFTIFSGLRLMGTPIIVSNLISTSSGMAFSFFANRRFVFSGAEQSSWKRQALLFFPGTAFGMYVLQTLAILFLVRVFPAPLDLAEALGRLVGFHSDGSVTLLRSNTAKLGATAVSLAWNFVFYRWAVFAPRAAVPPISEVQHESTFKPASSRE